MASRNLTTGHKRTSIQLEPEIVRLVADHGEAETRFNLRDRLRKRGYIGKTKAEEKRFERVLADLVKRGRLQFNYGASHGRDIYSIPGSGERRAAEAQRQREEYKRYFG